MASPDHKPPPSPQMGFTAPPANPGQHGFVNPVAGKDVNPPPYNPYPPTGGPYPPTGGPYPPTGGPYPPTGGPYPPSGGPYPPSGAPNSPARGPNPPVEGGPYPPYSSSLGPHSFPGAPNPQMGGRVSPAPSGGRNSPAGGPYPPTGGPYPPTGGPYPPPDNQHLNPSGPGIQPVGPYSPAYPGSPGYSNTSGDPLIAGYKPEYPGQPGMAEGDNVPKIGDEESNLNFAFSDKTIRRQFIKKVYAILMAQLFITFGFVALCLFHKGIQESVSRHHELMWVSIGVTFATLIPMVCCTSARRKFPINFILLALFTGSQAFMIGMVTTLYQEDSVLIALGMTSVVCLSLTVFAFQTKYDFTTMGGVLLVLLVVFVVMGFVLAFFPGDKVRVVYAALGALLFSFYLIYDTQLIIGGNHKMSISPEEYIFAALNIYLDVLNLFLYILKIMGQKK